jgi:photosystem II stability/assembly factor-like uncharacterized protein
MRNAIGNDLSCSDDEAQAGACVDHACLYNRDGGFVTRDGGHSWATVPIDVTAKTGTSTVLDAAERAADGSWLVSFPTVWTKAKPYTDSWSQAVLPRCGYVVRWLGGWDAEHFYAVQDGCVCYSKDGGRSWGVAKLRGPATRGNGMAQDRQVWGAGKAPGGVGWLLFDDSQIYVTKDFGSSWRATPLIRPRRKVADGPVEVAFSSERKGYLIEGKGQLWSTVDGGRQWLKQKTNQQWDGLATAAGVVWLMSEGKLYRVEE